MATNVSTALAYPVQQPTGSTSTLTTVVYSVAIEQSPAGVPISTFFLGSAQSVALPPPATLSVVSAGLPSYITPFPSTSTPSSSVSQASTTDSSATSVASSSPSPSGTSTNSSTSSTSTSAAASASVSSSPTPNNTGYIAGIAVLAAVAAIALIALAFVLLRNRRKHYTRAAGSEKDIGYDPAVIALKDKVSNLQNDLNSKDANLRHTQGALLGSGRGASAVAVMDDKTVNGQFARLNKEIGDWVMRNFKNAPPTANPPRELTSTLIRTQSNYSFLLQESRTRFLLLRAIAAEQIAEAMNDGSLFGNSEFTRMQQSMSGHASDPAQLAQWRAMTASVLSSSNPSSNETISSLAQRIDYSTSSLVNAPASEARLQQLQNIVRSAQQLAIDLSKQQPNFVFERPQTPMFDPVVMEDVLQEKRGEDLKGKQVQSVIFPAVFRYGNSEGLGYDSRTVISKAAVLV